MTENNNSPGGAIGRYLLFGYTQLVCESKPGLTSPLMRLKPNVGNTQNQVCLHPIITDSSSLTTTIHKMELTTPSDLQPPTHPPTAILEGVTAGHLHVHMNSSGLLSAFLRVRLIYKSARRISDPCNSPNLWTLSAFVSAHIFFTVHVLAEHKPAQSTTVFTILWYLSQDVLLNSLGSFVLVPNGTFISASVQLNEEVRDVFLVIFWLRIAMT